MAQLEVAKARTRLAYPGASAPATQTPEHAPRVRNSQVQRRPLSSLLCVTPQINNRPSLFRQASRLGAARRRSAIAHLRCKHMDVDQARCGKKSPPACLPAARLQRRGRFRSCAVTLRTWVEVVVLTWLLCLLGDGFFSLRRRSSRWCRSDTSSWRRGSRSSKVRQRRTADNAGRRVQAAAAAAGRGLLMLPVAMTARMTCSAEEGGFGSRMRKTEKKTRRRDG